MMKNAFFGVFALIAVVVAFSVSGCAKEPVSRVPEGYALVWQDESDADGAPDPRNGLIRPVETAGATAKYRIIPISERTPCFKGQAHIEGDQQRRGHGRSARIKTQYLANWQYGYIEISAKLPSGVGTWPAIWMLPTHDKYGTWPRSGEIDIMEHVGFEQDIIHTTIHTKAYNHKINTQKNAHAKVPGVSKSFHTYAIDWTPDRIEWFVDGESFFVFENENATSAEWPFDIPYYLIMNVAIGGAWGGQKGIDANLKDASMVIDYVRVYQKQNKL